MAEQNSNDVRAINFSFGEPLWLDPRPDAVLDGNALLTLCIDWSANHHNTLYVIAGNQGRGGIPIPTDNYNGINVASSHAHSGRYDQVDVSSLGNVFEEPFDRLVGLETNIDGRLLISLLAGRDVKLLSQQGEVFPSTGTILPRPMWWGPWPCYRNMAIANYGRMPPLDLRCSPESGDEGGDSQLR